MGYAMLETVIRARKNIVDISFFEEDPFDLDALAKEMGVTAVVDCGVAPGMANIILGDHTRTMKVNDYQCYVGGLPKIRKQPFEYKAPFSPIDVIAEYTRPSRIVENGKVIVKPALSDITPMEFEGIGTLECFNTDGLRSLLKTMDIPQMLEKTLRYPNHANLMKMFRDIGFFDETPIKVKGISIKPVDLTAALIFPHWKLQPAEVDFTILKMIISGDQDGAPVTYTYTMYDEYDPETDALSMARTTGYTCTAVARLVLNNGYSQKGISPPEYVGMVDGCKDRVMNDLKERGIEYKLHCS
jgi:saccharopine dehydrogenase-like NADP-dependent oxidoreductase